MGFDYSNFSTFVENFTKFSTEFESWITKFMVKQGMAFLREVKPRTPVDTGDLRNHWRLAGVTRNGDVLHAWFVNPMEYTSFVEYGHAKPYLSGIATVGGPDWVEGYFMMTVSIEVVERNMPARFNSEFNKFILSLGVG